MSIHGNNNIPTTSNTYANNSISLPSKNQVGEQGKIEIGNSKENIAANELGESFSIGKTIARIFSLHPIAFLIDCISSLFTSKAQQAHALPHLPQNQNNLATNNKDLESKILNQSPDILPTINNAKNKIDLLFSDFSSIDNATYTANLAKKIAKSPILVDNQKLSSLAEETAKELHAKNISLNLFNEHPLSGQVSDIIKNGLANKLQGNPQLQALAHVDDAKQIPNLFGALKDRNYSQIQGIVDAKIVQEEILEAGKAKFYDLTGVDKNKNIGTESIEKKMGTMRDNINNTFANPEKPYLKADQNTLREGMKDKVDNLFTNRAKAYNSINTLNVPEKIGASWKEICIKGQESFSSNLFVFIKTISDKIIQSGKLQELSNPTAKPNEIIKTLNDIATLLDEQMIEVIGEANLTKMGVDEMGLLSGQIFILTTLPESSELLNSVKNNPTTFININDALSQERTELSDKVESNNDPGLQQLIKVTAFLQKTLDFAGV